MYFQSFFLFLLVLFLNTTNGDPSCEEYEGNLCTLVVGAYSHNVDNKIFKILSNLPQFVVEDTLINSGFGNLSLVGTAFLPDCYLAASKYFCGSYFASCNDTTGQPIKVPVCKSVCNNFISECSEYFELIGKGEFLDQDCESLPEEGTQVCESMGGVQLNFEEVTCQEPLVRNPNTEIFTNTCPGACCVPCPTLDAFYPKGLIKGFYITWLVLSILSFFGALFVFLTYLFLPEKRKFPQVIVLCMAVAGTLAFAMGWITVGYGRDKLFCSDEVTPASGEEAPVACIVQGIVITYSLLTCALWFAFLVLNVHLNVVWKKQTLEDYPVIYHVCIWCSPLISVVALAYSRKLTNQSGVWCHPEQGIWIEATLLIPLGLIIFPSFVFNLSTLWKIYKVSKETKESISKILLIQLRPFFFTFAALVVLVAYWTFAQSVQGVTFSSRPAWLYDWIVCVQNGLGQTECSKYARPPNVGGMFVADVLLHSLGIIVFFFFGFRLEIIKGWFHLLFPKYFSEFGSSYSHGHSFQEQQSHLPSSKSTHSNLNVEKTLMELKE